MSVIGLTLEQAIGILEHIASSKLIPKDSQVEANTKILDFLKIKNNFENFY